MKNEQTVLADYGGKRREADGELQGILVPTIRRSFDRLKAALQTKPGQRAWYVVQALASQRTLGSKWLTPRRLWQYGEVLCVASVLAGCSREDIRVYRVPKEEPRMAVASNRDRPPAIPKLQWKTPPGWKEESAGGMRVAKFSVPGNGGQNAEVSVIPLPEVSAPKKDIVNLWRDQIKLAPIEDQDLTGLLEKVETGPGEAELFDMVSTEPLPDQKSKTRIVVVMLSQAPFTWFFKMTGEDTLVRDQKPAFLTFLKSISFGPASEEPVPASPHDFLSQNSASIPAAQSASEAPAKPAWEVPVGWKEQAPGQMLLAKFVVTASGVGGADITVSVFPGDTGGLLANVNRWRGQVGLKPVEPSELQKQIASLDVTGGKATVVDVTGVSPRTGKKTRLIGAIVPRDGQTWFYKLMGDEDVADQQKAAFLKFVQTIKYPNAA